MRANRTRRLGSARAREKQTNKKSHDPNISPPRWGATATGSPWLCDHLWEHYDYNRDKEYLKWAYPIMKGSAEFFLDMLITDPKTGLLVTAPSNSPR